MGLKSLFVSAALLASAFAQEKYATYQDGNGRALAVNIPEDTANSGSGSIFLQITAPSGTQWLAFGQGSAMNNANMFVIYSSGNNVVLSPRTTTGHNTPQLNSDASVKLLDGSAVQSDGSMLANIQCDSCLSWSGGSMKATDSSSSWIMAYKDGSALNTDDTSASISRHDSHDGFSLDLTQGISGNSANPFLQSASASATDAGTATSTGSPSGTASASSTSGTARPSSVVTGNSGSSDSASKPESSSDNIGSLRQAHGVIMSVLFVGAFPLFALALYLPTANKVRFIHAPLQALSVILLIAGLALGIQLGQKLDELDTYHQIIGFIVVFLLVLVQPAMGVAQHLHFHKTGGRSMWGVAHQGLGRGAISLGIVNGGLGFHIAGKTSAYVPYAVCAVLVFVIYVLVVGYFTFRSRSSNGAPVDRENKSPNDYEMQNKHRRLGSGAVEQTTVQPKTERS